MPQHGDLASHAGAENDRASAPGAVRFRRQRLGGVAGNVQQGLDQLLPVPVQVGNARVVVAQDRNPVPELGDDQRAYALEDFVDVEWRRLPWTLMRKQPIEERLQSIGFLDDYLRVFDQFGAFQLALEQLRRAAQTAERSE